MSKVLCFKTAGGMVAGLLAAASAFGQANLDSPRGGWRNSSGDTSRYTQEISYPAVSVNTPQGVSALAKIEGIIRQRVEHGVKPGIKPAPMPDTKQPHRPHTLIVNGAGMPLRAEADGRFARPYAFGRGSNSVEVRPADGTKPARRQFYDGAAQKIQARLRVVLSWDSDGTDLDLHVVTPEGGHAFYGNRVLANGGALDVDVTTGYGPEIFASPAPVKGQYHVYVNYFGAGEARGILTVAQVALIFNENTPDEKQEVFRVPMRTPGELQLVKSFSYP